MVSVIGNLLTIQSIYWVVEATFALDSSTVRMASIAVKTESLVDTTQQVVCEYEQSLK